MTQSLGEEVCDRIGLVWDKIFGNPEPDWINNFNPKPTSAGWVITGCVSRICKCTSVRVRFIILRVWACGLTFFRVRACAERLCVRVEMTISLSEPNIPFSVFYCFVVNQSLYTFNKVYMDL